MNDDFEVAGGKSQEYFIVSGEAFHPLSIPMFPLPRGLVQSIVFAALRADVSVSAIVRA